MEILILPIEVIKATGATQSRVSLNEAAVAEYAEIIRFGGDLPPVVVFEDGSDIWLADGFHRYHAHRAAGAMDIACEVRQGTKRDAVLFSVGANAAHGLRRTNEDKRRAVMTLLNDAEWAKWSDREIAKQCGVSHPFVAAIRSPAVAAKQQENREASAAPRPAAVESDSTNNKAKNTPESIIDDAPESGMVAAPLAKTMPAAKTAEYYLDDVAALKEQLVEVAEALKSTVADNEMMGRVFDADDKLKAAMDEAKRQKAVADSAERTLAAKNGEFVARAQQVTYWKNRATKAEAALAKVAA